MPAFFRRRDVLRAALAAGASQIALPARACEFFSASLRVFHPWTRETDFLDTAAVVCMKFDQVTAGDRLIGIDTPVATGAELVGPGRASAINLPMAPGEVITLREDDLHLRLTGLTMPLELGRVYPLNLIFERGGLLATNLSVDYTRTQSTL